MRRTNCISIAALGLVWISATQILADDEFTALFGLATAPNGDLLAADAAAGIFPISARGVGHPISVPGSARDGAPIGRASMWVVTGAATEDGTFDSGQGLHRVSIGRARTVVNLFEFEAGANPDGGVVESNPFDVESLGGSGALVADAAANDLLMVNNRGGIDVLAVFPNELVSTANLKSLAGCPDPPPDTFPCNLPPMMPAQPVPTSIAVGGDFIYVGELKGFPAPTGESNIWRISPDASWAQCGTSPNCVKAFDGGFTSIIDLAWGPDGRLYVLELDEASWFVLEGLGTPLGGTVNACDVTTGVCDVVAAGIPIPTAITFGKNGRLWTTRNALIPGVADVVAVP